MAKVSKVESIESQVKRLVSESAKGKEALEAARAAAETSVREAGSAQLQAIIRVAKSLPSITLAMWKASYKAPMEAEFRVTKKANGELVYSEGSLFSIVAQHGAAVIAAQQGIEPEYGDRLSTYATRGRKAQEGKKNDKGETLYEPSNKGGRKDGQKIAKAKSGKSVEVTRESALAMIVGTDKSDQEVVTFLVSKHMDKLRTLYASLVKA